MPISTKGMMKMVRNQSGWPACQPFHACQTKIETIPFQNSAKKSVPATLPTGLSWGFRVTGDVIRGRQASDLPSSTSPTA